MKPKHTPGSWKFTGECNSTQEWSVDIGGCYEIVAAEDDARLISLCPEMLEGLKMAGQSLRIAGMHESADRIESLISRAEDGE